MLLFLKKLGKSCGDCSIEAIGSNRSNAASDINDKASEAFVIDRINDTEDEIVKERGCAKAKEYEGENGKHFYHKVNYAVKEATLLLGLLIVGLLVVGLLIVRLLIVGLLIVRLLIVRLLIVGLLTVHNISPLV